MSIKIFNTLTRAKELFAPINPPIVKAYFCGPTVYDHVHLGHVRAYVAFDIIKRYLMLRGYTVFHVQNITDIDDKIIKRAQEEGVPWREVADTYAKEYMEVLEKLRIRVDLHPRVTDHINEIIKFVETLVERGLAYVAPSGSVYFDLSTASDYGKLSKKFNREEWRQEEEYLREKRNPYDFALWKSSKPGEPWWESPWGRGRPGWHTECAVMSIKYLGSQFDIHGGGQDLIFPHHENELAMAEAASGARPWVRYWLHVGYLTMGGEKMSKSLGNVITANEALKRWSPEVLRLWIFSSHYRKQLEFSEESLEAAKRFYERLALALGTLRKVAETTPWNHRLSDKELEVLKRIESIEMAFHEAMSDDFNTPKALEAVSDLLTLTFKELEPLESHALAVRAYHVLYNFNRVLGVLDKYFEERALEGPAYEALNKLVDIIIEVRNELRRRKEYELSDKIREDLLKLGIKVFDYKEGSKWVWEL